jgi:hypothetical protein
MLNDVLVVCLAIGLWLALGYPVARKLGPSVIWPALAAWPLGLAVFAFLMVVLYASGLRLETAFNICIGLAIPGLVLAGRDALGSSLNRSHGAFLVALVIAMLLVLLPKWLGRPEFSVFQSNIADQFNYLSSAWMELHYDYPTILGMDIETRIATGFGFNMPAWVALRPAATLMLGGFASAVGQPVLVISYAYLAALQLCMLFASLFVLRNVIELSNAYSLFLALSVTVGFFLQYAFDINAWSALAALSLVTLYAGLLTLGLATSGPGEANRVARGLLGEAGFFGSMLVCMAGFWYIYPEILSLVATISAPIVAYQFFMSADRGYVLRRLLLLVLAAGGAIALCTLAWSMTIGFALQQMRFIADPVMPIVTADWWKVTHRYLFGFDVDWNTAFDFIVIWHRSALGFLYHVFSIVTSFLAGILGVYFLQPAADIPPGFRLVWKLGLLAALAGLLGFSLWGLLRASGEPPQRLQRALFVGVLGGLTLMGGLLLVGQSWAAGKGLIWLSPLLMLALIGSLLSDKRIPNLIRAVALIYVGSQVGFGGYRSYAAARDIYGAHYWHPYPLDVGRKLYYRWDYAGLQAALKGCSRVSVDIDDVYHEQFVYMALADMGIRWWSRHPLFGSGRSRDDIQKQIDNPDCAVTTQARSIQPDYAATIWLLRDDRVLRFYRGETDRLILVPNLPRELESEGFAADEAAIVGQVRTNGHAVIRVPNNPKAPVKRLTLAVDPEQPAGIHVTVLINGRPVLDDVASRGGDRTDWSRTVELPDFGEEAWLNIAIDSDTPGVSGDARPLRARLRLLSLER